MNLNALRKQINNIDLNILKLIEKRISVVKQIALIKKQSNLSLVDKKREKEILNRLITKAKNFGISLTVTKKIFKYIIKQSKKIEKNI